jgi:probable F420-dependent oxidoreductase
MSVAALHGTGIWNTGLRSSDPSEAADAAAELEQLGYTALWIAGGTRAGVLDRIECLLDATSTISLASGILSVWTQEPGEVAAAHARLTAAHPGRFVLGLGVSHRRFVDGTDGPRYERPLATMRGYLDALDAAARPVPQGERVLAALRPRMLGLARDRTAGAHPYLVTPEHTAHARELLGPDALLAPEQTVVLETDPSRAREIARQHLAIYLPLENYNAIWRNLGFRDEDFAGGGSDRLIDALVPWGGEDSARRVVEAHRAAGADHVCVQVATGDREGVPREGWRRLAPALLG